MNLKTGYTEQVGCQKKTLKTLEPIQKLKEIKISQLQVWNTHVGRFLKLKVVYAFQAAAIQIETKDDSDSSMRVSIYNFPLKGLSFSHYFYPGQVFYIKQPFFKIARAGNENVRVDDPKDVEFMKADESSILEGYRKRGKDFIAK